MAAAVVLIGIGVVLLLMNLGVLDWSLLGAMLRLWPLLLIAVGLDLMIGRERRAVAVVAGVAVALLIAPLLWWVAERPQTFRTEIITQPLAGAERAEVKLDVGVATLSLSALAMSDDNLMEGKVRLAGDEKISRSFVKEAGKATLSLGHDSRTGALSSVFGGDPTWEIQLTRRVPLKLDVECGVGAAELDLRGLSLSDFRIETGVGRVEVILPDSGHLRARLHGGVGKAVIKIPASMEARIEATAGLGSVEVSEDFEKQGKRFVTSKYARGANRTDLEVEGGVGSIVIERLPASSP
jgi:hypothetical protein